jgi:hypothetical protein
MNIDREELIASVPFGLSSTRNRNNNSGFSEAIKTCRNPLQFTIQIRFLDPKDLREDGKETEIKLLQFKIAATSKNSTDSPNMRNFVSMSPVIA